MDDKYKMLKNLIHNEYGITKEDIQYWVKDAVQSKIDTEFRIYVNSNGGDLHEMVRTLATKRINTELDKMFGKQFGGVSNDYKDMVSRMFAEAMREKIIISLKEEAND